MEILVIIGTNISLLMNSVRWAFTRSPTFACDSFKIFGFLLQISCPSLLPSVSCICSSYSLRSYSLVSEIELGVCVIDSWGNLEDKGTEETCDHVTQLCHALWLTEISIPRLNECSRLCWVFEAILTRSHIACFLPAVELKCRQLFHITYKLFLVSLAFQNIGVILLCIAYGRYASNGVGLSRVKLTGENFKYFYSIHEMTATHLHINRVNKLIELTLFFANWFIFWILVVLVYRASVWGVEWVCLYTATFTTRQGLHNHKRKTQTLEFSQIDSILLLLFCHLCLLILLWTIRKIHIAGFDEMQIMAHDKC